MALNNTVMLVEDDPAMQSALKTLLELEGYSVVTPPNWKDADGIIWAVLDAKPAFMLLDVHLGAVDGVEILKRLHSAPERRQMRILMSSGMDMRDACLSAGADDFILKPFMPDELLKRLPG